MKDETTDRDEDESTRELLQAAGPRPSMPLDVLEAIRNEARAVWRARFVTEPGTRARWRWMMPLAAAVCAAAFLGWWFVGRTSEDAIVAVVARVESSRGASGFSAGQPLLAGATIETADHAWLALSLAGGQSLRLDEGTKVTLISVDSVSLERGGVYLDSLHGVPVTIATVAGDFVPAGTQFELRLVGDAVQLRVREGQVALKQRRGGSEPAVARAGQQLIVRQDGTLHRDQIGRSDADWDWILAVIRVPEIEGRTLQSFLDWMARERGWSVEFGSSEAARLSREVILHGSVSEMSPDDALNTVMLSSGFTHQVSNGTLVVSRP